MSEAAAAWDDAARAALLLAVDPHGLGGIVVRAGAGPVRDRWLEGLHRLTAPAMPRRLPLGIVDERLVGGLDLTATLGEGRLVVQRGLLAEADGGIVVAAMAERMELRTAAIVSAALDRGVVEAEPARFGLVALDEGDTADERVPAGLADRLAFRAQLDGIPLREAPAPGWDPDQVLAARACLAETTVSPEIERALCGAALALGVWSLRASLFALRAARVAAALDGRTVVEEADAALAARLVLAPRATQLPQSEAEGDDAPPPPEEPPPPEPPESDRPDDNTDTPETEQAEMPPLEDLLLAAAAAAIPPDLLARLQLARADKARRGAVGKAGAATKAETRGRPAGIRRVRPRSGARLNLIETLRAAIPWQRLRGRAPGMGRVAVRPEDFRATRYLARMETTIIFVVDASGSAALTRLAETKGAVELVLAECYARRDRVALIGFRGSASEVLLPPTRSLIRAKRSLAGLPGGGGTPLAAGLDGALALADAVARQGQTPVVVLLTDGRANIARDGNPGRDQAQADALESARSLRLAGVSALLVDTSPRPQEAARRLAAEMAATYLALPFADSSAIAGAVSRSTAPS
jgi:magnesium chelatase subunit D